MVLDGRRLHFIESAGMVSTESMRLAIWAVDFRLSASNQQLKHPRLRRRRPRWLRSLWLCSLASALGILGSAGMTVRAADQAVRPNVIVILADDLGSVDLNCYGSTDLVTPALDQLAARGVRLTQFYAAAPLCSPSRAALLTGRYPLRCGVPSNVSWRPEALSGLPADEVTLAELFRDAGYATSLVGKWHLGHSAEMSPQAHGFDRWFGHLGGCIDNYSHFFYWDGPNRHDLYRDGTEVFHDGDYFPDLMIAESIRFLASDPSKPKFLYLALNLPHYPYQPEARWLDRFADLPAPRNLYAAFVATLDQRLGTLFQAVETAGQTANTLVIFQSDHGHSTEERGHFGGGSSGPYRGAKFSLLEGGLRVPAIISWPTRLPQAEVRNQVAHACDWLPTLVELCGLRQPEQLLDGRSLVSVLESADAPSPHDVLHWQVGRGPNADWAVRAGDWKLIGHSPDTTDGRNHRALRRFLSHLTDDVSEARDWSATHPDVVQQLEHLHDEWYQSVAERKPVRAK